MSLARRHRERMAAIALAGVALTAPSAGEAAPAPENTEYSMLLEQLGEDFTKLSNIQSIERKIEEKRAMIVRYDSWVEGALLAGSQGEAVQDEIVANMLIWNMDIQNWTMALHIATHVLTHGLRLPERYKRTAATVIAEEVADASLANVAAVDHGTLIATRTLTDDQDMPDEVRAKLMKAIGRKLVAEADAFDPDGDAGAGGKPALIAAALEALKRALSLDQRVGVKKDIETLERELTKLSPPT